MTPPRHGDEGGGFDEQRPDETARLEDTKEHELEGDDAAAAGDTAEHPPPEPPSEELEAAGGEKPGLDAEEQELERIVSAETEEWEGAEVAAGADGDAEDAEDLDEDDLDDEDEHEVEEVEEEPSEEKTLVARAGSAITSGFDAVGSATTSGVKAVGKHVRFPLWARFMTGSFLIVASIAAATTASLLLYIGDIAEALDPDKEFQQISDRLAEVDGGEPQTILILGSDKRPEDKTGQFKGLSDTTMLLRVDPDENALALFSLPRDLRVNIPGYGVDKLNAAYAYGGPELTLRTVQELTKVPATNMQGLEINHVVNIDFEGFARAVNALGCVYIDVDRRYFNKNTIGDGQEDYEEIDLQPGYQALCGFDALDYARYRHTDNDVVRAARQQDFLREARQKVPPEVLFADRKKLISIFTEHTTSDINSADAMLEVLKLFIEARNAPLKQVKFEGTLGPSFVEATPEEINRAVEDFLGFEDTPGARASTSAPEDPEAVGTPDVAPDQAGNRPPSQGRGRKTGGGRGKAADVVRTSYGKQLAKGIRARRIKLPVYYPTVLEEGSEFAQKPRVYKINGTGEDAPPNSERAAYKWVFSRPTLGEYYGFMATRWKEPPLLRNPSEERDIGDRTYKLYYDGDRLRMIAWQTDEGSFWVSNTLAQSLTDRELLAVAEGMAELPRRTRG